MEKQPIVIDCGNCEYNDGTGRCDPNNCRKIPGMSTHQFNVILRGICNGAALRNKQPEILILISGLSVPSVPMPKHSV